MSVLKQRILHPRNYITVLNMVILEYYYKSVGITVVESLSTTFLAIY